MPSDSPEVPDGIAPGFNASIAHPFALKVMVTGMDFLSDGRMALAPFRLYYSRGGIVRNFKVKGMGNQRLTLRGMDRGIYWVRTTDRAGIDVPNFPGN